ncbi:MAG: porin family protein [Prevotella ruminicola]|jgi:hypothetical protein|uniref:Porin family protein n=1 Tax=Xylanibacter ruminicola TaxID=839 RepID=A0A9D5S988_XYLRU|nr:porin family protein [Xylanibacter ruminicola]
MKKFFTLVVLLATITVAQAQVKFGVKGGLNLTNMKFDNSVVDKSNQTGFFIGPTLNFTLPVVGLGIDASALYDQRSAKIEGSEDKLKQQSIQIPINLRYGFGLGNTASLYIFAGPQFGFNIGDKSANIVDNALEWRLKDSNLSANVGVGLMLLNHLQVSANYNIALGTTGETNVLSSTTSTVANLVTGKTKANAWQLSVAYFF